MNKLAVIIGRFQTPYLHKGHLRLIEEAKSISDDVLIFIGCTAAVGTDKNPLDYITRVNLFYKAGALSNPMILALDDCPSDKDWSDSIDKHIDYLGYTEAIILGGRDNSIQDSYSGKHQIKIIDAYGNHSATALRKIAAREPMYHPHFRSGIIYHAENRYPIVYSTVDVVITYKDSFLMGKKGDKFYFIGGFVDPNDENLKAAAMRELKEETTIEEITLLSYHSSLKIDDYRYKNTKDSIMTHIFKDTVYLNPLDLIEFDKIKDKEFKEFRLIEFCEIDRVADCHKPIFKLFNNY